MTNTSMVCRVIIVPRNGYANRLQAWASAAVLADQCGARLHVLWEPQEVAQSPADLLFGSEILARDLVSSADVTSLLGQPHQSEPRYLNVDRDRDVITLAGHERGEQAFMPDLARVLAELTRPTVLLIIAGGLFHLPDIGDFRSARQAFYGKVQWSEAINDLVAPARAEHGRYAALHIRQTDRSREAPTEAATRGALSAMASQWAERSLFICADTAEARLHWASTARELRFSPWTLNGVDFDRNSPRNGVTALAEWLLLGHALGLIYPAASSFSTEATVLGGSAGASMALSSGLLTRTRRDAARWWVSGTRLLGRGAGSAS